MQIRTHFSIPFEELVGLLWITIFHRYKQVWLRLLWPENREGDGGNTKLNYREQWLQHPRTLPIIYDGGERLLELLQLILDTLKTWNLVSDVIVQVRVSASNYRPFNSLDQHIASKNSRFSNKLLPFSNRTSFFICTVNLGISRSHQKMSTKLSVNLIVVAPYAVFYPSGMILTYFSFPSGLFRSLQAAPQLYSHYCSYNVLLEIISMVEKWNVYNLLVFFRTSSASEVHQS